jgi:hypothetical protein
MLTDIGASAPSAQLPLTRFTRNPSRNDLKGFETGVNRQANAALFRVAIVRMKDHEPTLVYVKKRTREGKSKREMIRCLKRYIIREIFKHLCCPQVGKTAC